MRLRKYKDRKRLPASALPLLEKERINTEGTENRQSTEITEKSSEKGLRWIRLLRNSVDRRKINEKMPS
jgi:hypothetical protein